MIFKILFRIFYAFLEAIIVFVIIALVLFCFRGYFANLYADFLYKEVLPHDFNKDDFFAFKEQILQTQTLPKNNLLQNHNALPSSAIVNLGGFIESRLFFTIALYYYGVSDIVFITSPRSYIYDDFGGSIQSELKQMRLALDYARVPYDVIPSFKGEGAQSTLDEAIDIAVYLKSNPLENIIIITSESHSKRAYEIFKRVFCSYGITTHIFILPVENKFFNRHNWYKSEAGIINYILEFPKMIMFYLRIGEIKGVQPH